MAKLDIVFDDQVPPGAVRLFMIIARRFASGFYGRRDTLAKMAHMSKTTVDTYVAKLARLGYVKTAQRKHMPAIIYPVAEAMHASGLKIQDLDVASKQDLDVASKSLNNMVNKTMNLNLVIQSVPNPSDMAGVAILRALNVREDLAADLASQRSTDWIRAAAVYATRKAEKNPAGFIVAAIRDGFRIPGWAFAEAKKIASKKIEPPKKQPEPKPSSGSRTTDDAWDLAVSVSDIETWSGILANLKGRIQPAIFESFFDGKTALQSLDAGRMVVIARDQAVADWIREHYIEIIQAVAEEVTGERPQIEISMPAASLTV